MTVKFWHSSFWWIKGRHDKLGSFLYCCILSINSIWSWQVSTIWITKRGTIKTLFYLRWLLLGGYTNVEGGSHTRPLDTVDLLTLDQEGEFMTHDVSCDTWHVTRDTWHMTCQVSLLTRAPGAPLPGLHCPGRWTQPQWPGLTPTWDYLPAGLGLYLANPSCDDVKITCFSGSASFSSAHYTTALARALVCGGGDSIYNVTR